MRYAPLVAAALSLASVTAVRGAEAPEVRLSVEDAVKMALEKNLDLEIDRYKPLIATEKITEARAEFHPYMDYDLSYSRQHRFLNSILEFQAENGIVDETRVVPEASIAGKLTSGTGYKLSASAQTIRSDNPLRLYDVSYQPQVVLSFTQPLLRGFGRSYNLVRVKQAREVEKQALLQVKTSMLEVIQDVETRYWLLSFAQQHLEIARKNLDVATELIDRLTRMREAGMSTDLDVSQAQLAAEERKSSLARAEADLKIAQVRLRVSVDPNLPVGTHVIALETPVDEGPPDALQKKVDRALAARPEIEYQESVIDSMALEEKQARSNARWELNTFGSATYAGLGGRDLNPTLTNPLNFPVAPQLPPKLVELQQELEDRDSLSNAFNDAEHSWTLGMNLQIPLGSRSSLAEVVPKRLRRTQEEIRLQRVRQQIRTEIETAYHNMSAEWSRLNSAREAVRLAQLQLNAVGRNLEVGINTVWDVIEAQDRLATALDAEGRALAFYATARTGLQAAQAESFEVHRLVVEP